jgi:hypothetical protein
VPGRWTSKRVEAVLVAAFAALPNTPIYSPRRNVLFALNGTHLPPGPEKVLVWTSRYLPRESPERLALLMWARHKAMPAESLRSLIGQMGWEWRTFQRRRKRAARIVCEGLHEDRVPLFDATFRPVARKECTGCQPGLEKSA